MTLYEEKIQEEIGRERSLYEQQQPDSLSLTSSDKPAKLARTINKRFKSLRYQRSRLGARWNGYTNKIGW